MRFDAGFRVEARGVDVQLEVADGETIALLGPNGAGKSTILAVAAGLLAPDDGRVILGGRTLVDVSGGRGTSLPAWRRGVSLLAQDALLFPHLSVRQNVAFGPRSAGRSRAEARRRADDWLERVGAEEFAGRRPGELSGGQSQRVAVARALATEPDLLLLDEPLAALDADVAPALRRVLRDVLADRTAIVVTHDVLDAYTLADRVILLDRGRIVDAGPTRTVLDRPTTPFAAGLAGLGLILGRSDGGHGVVLDDGQRVSGRASTPMAAGTPVGLSVRPSAVRVARAASGGGGDDPRGNGLSLVLSDVEPRGDAVRVRSGGLAADVPPGEAAVLDLRPGDAVRFDFAPSDAFVYPL